MDVRLTLFASLIVLILLAPLGCKKEETSTPNQEAVTTSPLPIGTEYFEVAQLHPLSWEKGPPERKVWSEVLEKAVVQNFASLDRASDMASICRGYSRLGQNAKINAWMELFSAMAKFESSWNPATKYPECSKTKCQYSGGCKYVEGYGYCMKGGHALDGGVVISRGLEQISLQSALGYGCSWLKNPQDLHNPEKNLRCAVQIMKRQVERTGKVMASSNYWAVIKSTSKWNKIPQIKSMVQALPFCK